MTAADRRWRVTQVLRDFNVRLHTEATSRARRDAGGFGPKFYAVWAEGKQVSVPADHATAKRDAERLQIEAIVAIFEGQSAAGPKALPLGNTGRASLERNPAGGRK